MDGVFNEGAEVVADLDTDSGDGKTRTLLVRTTTEVFRLTIPASYRITFGYFNPGIQGNDGSRYHPHTNRSALRLWESKEKQRACFMDVVEFRDVTEVRVEREYVDPGTGARRWAEDNGYGITGHVAEPGPTPALAAVDPNAW